MTERIAFLCGSLTPGRDGVGDYVRNLAGELERRGASCLRVSLCDGGALEDSAELLRLPATLPWPERIARLRERLALFQPAWVSLQFVPYAFHGKGLVTTLGRHLRPALGDTRLHLMFHELWIGHSPRAPWKHRLIGAAQRALILRLLRQLAPECVTTTNPSYQRLLRRRGVEAEVLPLFGNIPVTPGLALPELRALHSHWIFVFFGTLHPEWLPEPLFTSIRSAAAHLGKKVAMLAIGRLGPGEALWRRLAAQYGQSFQFLHLGELPPERISAALQAADVGIAASPWDLIGKSGTAVSMLEHGLPVIVTRRGDGDWSGAAPDPQLIPADSSLGEKLLGGLPKRPASSRLPAVAAGYAQLFAPALIPPLLRKVA